MGAYIEKLNNRQVFNYRTLVKANMDGFYLLKYLTTNGIRRLHRNGIVVALFPTTCYSNLTDIVQKGEKCLSRTGLNPRVYRFDQVGFK